VPRIAVAGRPNVGKSTLINALLGEERVIAFDQAGTTRDAISIPFERNGKRYTLIDTAGLRRKGRVFETIEKFSVIKTVQAIEQANVCVLVLDATQEVSDQDAHIGGFIVESGRALVLAVNKWDAVDSYRREIFKREIARKLGFLGFARHLFISALEGQGVGGLFGAVDAAYAAAMTKLPTPKLTRALQAAVEKQSPPKHGLFRPKMRYAHQGGMNPPVIVIHGAALWNTLPTATNAISSTCFSKRSSCRGRRCGLNSVLRTIHSWRARNRSDCKGIEIRCARVESCSASKNPVKFCFI
jgi:GTP-binding protein